MSSEPDFAEVLATVNMIFENPEMTVAVLVNAGILAHGTSEDGVLAIGVPEQFSQKIADLAAARRIQSGGEPFDPAKFNFHVEALSTFMDFGVLPEGWDESHD